MQVSSDIRVQGSNGVTLLPLKEAAVNQQSVAIAHIGTQEAFKRKRSGTLPTLEYAAIWSMESVIQVSTPSKRTPQFGLTGLGPTILDYILPEAGKEGRFFNKLSTYDNGS